MTINTGRLLLAGCLSTLAAPAGFAGSIVTGQSIDFEAGDFNQAGAGTKRWAIYDSASSSNTAVWAQQGMFFQNNGLAMNNASTSTQAQVTWKFTVPDSLSITSFDWAVGRVILNGSTAGDDKFTWSYSTDGSNWTVFYERDNRAATDTATVYLTNQSYTQSIAGAGVTTLYIRASHVEGTSIEGDSGYFTVVSNAVAGGGLNDNSFITLRTTSVIPEPASGAMAAGVLGLVGAVLLRRRRIARGMVPTR